MNLSNPFLNTFCFPPSASCEGGFIKRCEWITSIHAPTSHTVGNGKTLPLFLPQMSATLPSIHPIPSWALRRKLSFIEKLALVSLPEFLYLLQSALIPAATDTINTLYTPLSSEFGFTCIWIECNLPFYAWASWDPLQLLAFSPTFGSPESFIFPYKFASSLFTVFSASSMNALIGMNTSTDLCTLPLAPTATVKMGSILL